MTMKIRCVHCGSVKELEVDPVAHKKWMTGTLIQDAFPQMSADDRELLISKTCKECWDRIWKE